MIRGDVPRADRGATQDRTIVFSARNASALLRSLEPGAVVRVTVLSARADGTARVRIGDRTLVAVGLQRLSEGDAFDARVRVEAGAVLVTPIPERAHEGGSAALRALGIPDTPLSAFVVSFFRSIGARFDPATVRSVLSAAARFKGKEFRAAEAASLLVERGIGIDDETVARMVRVMEGSGGGSPDRDARDDAPGDDAPADGSADSGPADSDETGSGAIADDARSVDPVDLADRDFCAFVNHKRGRNSHWIVIPFRKNIADVPCSGSLRILLDVNRLRAASAPTPCRPTGCRMTLCALSREWDFSHSDGACAFAVNPGFPSVVFEQLVVYLKRWLAEAGITDVKAVDSGSVPFADVKSIDVEI